MSLFRTNLLILYVFHILLLSEAAKLEARNRTPARILAQQTGAAQFEERYETRDCNEHKHRLKKRSSDEDVDYEVYQGVVGRPGIDFPIFPRIPQTTFSCRSFGNGYFADLETDCQVFHICEQGRKISFLCPNGTIFQQSELTCDWWFKVNCAGSPGLYAESSEILNKARGQKVRTSVAVKEFQVVNDAVDNHASNVKHESRVSNENETTKRFRFHSKSHRRIDSNEEPISVETVDFDDISAEKQLNQKPEKLIVPLENNNNENEFQITAESASFVGNHRHISYNYDKPSTEKKQLEHVERRYQTNGNLQSKNRSSKESNRRKGNVDRISQQRNGHAGIQSVESNNESVERTKNKYRGTHRYDLKSQVETFVNTKPERTTESSSHEEPITVQRRFANDGSLYNNTTEDSIKPEYYNASKSSSSTGRYQSTQSYPGTYSTARRIDVTKTTPYYTPTIPAVSKARPTDSKFYNIKKASIVYAKSTSPESTITDDTPPCISHEPFTIGMRHSDSHRFPIASKGKISNLKTTDYSTQKPQATSSKYFSSDNVNSITTSSVLFASSPGQEESVTRNVNDMLKTVNMIKETFKDSTPAQGTETDEEKFQGKVRSGLEIPPSSGPDALVSFANYFANEPKEFPTAESLTSTMAMASTTLSDDIKSGLLSEKTVKQYSTLFGLKDPNVKQQSEDLPNGLARLTVNVSDEAVETTHSTLKKLAQKPETRKIASVFSNALTTYLEDPESFRKALTEARPTEPPTIDFTQDTVTDPTLFNKGTGATYLPTKSTPFIENHSTTIRSNDIAVEINSNFDSSTSLFDLSSSTEVPESTTFRFSTTKASPHLKPYKLDLSEELQPPNQEESEESLQRSQTQSFVKSMNELSITSKVNKVDNDKGKPNSAYTTGDSKQKTSNPTETPWSHSQSSQTVFLDPLTINDELMKEPKTTTYSSFTYLPKSDRTTTPQTDSQNRFEESNSSSGDFEDKFADLLNSHELSNEFLPSSSGLQRIANKLFGGLNEAEAQHLQNVMRQAENNRNVLKLLLLLIQTCDDHNGKILEKSRKSLLNALIEMDEERQRKLKLLSRSRPEKYISGGATTNRIPITTYRRLNAFDAITTTTPPITTMDYSNLITTTFKPETGTLIKTQFGQNTEETTRFQIRVADPEDETENSSTLSPNNSNIESSHKGSDQRALDLLKSLYSLASKFSSRRRR